MWKIFCIFLIKYQIVSCGSISFERSELFRVMHIGVHTGNLLTDVAKTTYVSNGWWSPWKNVIFTLENSILHVFILMNAGKLLRKCEILWCLSSEHWNTLWALHLVKREFTYTAIQICLVILSLWYWHFTDWCCLKLVLMLSGLASDGIYYW